MDRRQFLGLLTLIGCDNMQLTQQGILMSRGHNVMDAFLIIGDSVARGNSTAAGSTPIPGTVFQWNATTSQIAEVGSTDLVENVEAGTVGSEWPRFGIDYHANTGRKPYFIQTAIGGARWYHDSSAAHSWYTNGTCYSDAVTKANNGLAAAGITKLAGVFIILGVNDAAVATYTLSSTYLTSLIDRINTDFDTPQIFVSMPDKVNADANDAQRLARIRGLIRNLSRDYTNVEIAGNIQMIRSWDSAAYFQGDEFHLTFAGNEKLGELLARQMALPLYLNRLTRAICGSMFDDLSTARKNIIDTFILSQIASENIGSPGITGSIDNLFLFKQSSYKNGRCDWGFLSTAFTGGAVNIDHSWETDGSTNDIGAMPCSFNELNAEYDSDYIIGTRIATNNQAAGSAGTLMGVREFFTGGIIDTAQNSSSQLYFRCPHTSTPQVYTGETKFANDSMYAIARASGTEYLIKNKTVLDSRTIAVVPMAAAQANGFRVGARNNNATIDSRLSAEFVYLFSAKYSTFDLDSFYDNMEILLAAW